MKRNIRLSGYFLSCRVGILALLATFVPAQVLAGGTVVEVDTVSELIEAVQNACLAPARELFYLSEARACSRLL